MLEGKLPKELSNMLLSEVKKEEIKELFYLTHPREQDNFT